MSEPHASDRERSIAEADGWVAGVILRVPAAAVYVVGGLVTLLAFAYGCGSAALFLALGVLLGGIALNSAANLIVRDSGLRTRLAQATLIAIWLPILVVIAEEGSLGLDGALFAVACTVALLLLLAFGSLPHWWSVSQSWRGVVAFLGIGFGLFLAGLLVVDCSGYH